MSKLYIVNHLGDNVSNNVAAIINSNQEIQSGVDYKVSPVEVGFDYVKSLFKQFDEVVFDKNHNNYPVLSQQSELELIYNNSVDKINFKPLDKNKLIFFGCSHTAGIGHESKDTTYPFILSKMMNYEYLNFGIGSFGNYQIEDKLAELSITGCKLIVQFSDIYRYRFMLNSQIFPSPTTQVDGISESVKIYNIPHSYKDSKFVNEENLVFNFQNIVQRIVIRLRDSNNKFLITYTPHFENESIIQTLEFMYRFKEFVSTTGMNLDRVPDGHYGPLSHKLWADRLYHKWIELYGKE